MKPGELTDDEKAILEFAKLEWRFEGAREDAIFTQFGISRWRYAVRLQRLIADPRALAAEPQLVRRLLRQRDARRNHRSLAYRLGQGAR